MSTMDTDPRACRSSRRRGRARPRHAAHHGGRLRDRLRAVRHPDGDSVLAGDGQGVRESSTVTTFVVLGFAIVQIFVHMVYFLHMTSKAEGGWPWLSLIFTLVLVVITLSGSHVGHVPPEDQHDAAVAGADAQHAVMTGSIAHVLFGALPAPLAGVAPGDIAVGVVIGRTSEYFDYFVYGIASVLVFPAVFFPFESRLDGTLLLVHHLFVRVHRPADRIDRLHGHPAPMGA